MLRSVCARTAAKRARSASGEPDCAPEPTHSTHSARRSTLPHIAKVPPARLRLNSIGEPFMRVGPRTVGTPAHIGSPRARYFDRCANAQTQFPLALYVGRP